MRQQSCQDTSLNQPMPIGNFQSVAVAQFNFNFSPALRAQILGIENTHDVNYLHKAYQKQISVLKSTSILARKEQSLPQMLDTTTR